MQGLALPRPIKRLIPALIALVLVIIGILSRPLIPIDETRYLTVAWEMRHDGIWLYSHLNGANYSDKPPVLFWLINLAWAVTGPSEFVGRLVPALFLPVSVYLTGVLGRRIGGEAIGARAGYVAIGTTALALYGSLTMFDALLTAAALCGLIGLVDAARGKMVAGFAVVGVALGIGALIKGLPILILILPAALFAPLWAPRPQRWTRWYAGLVVSIVIGLAIGLTWAFSAQHAGGPSVRTLLVNQTAHRMVGAFTHKRPFWFFIALAPAMLFPWWLSRTFWSGVFKRGPADEDRRIYRLCWIVAAGTFVIFSMVSSKQAHYVLPTIPVLAIAFAGMTCLPAEAKREWLFAPALAIIGVVVLGLHFAPKLVHAPISLWVGGFLVVASVGLWFLPGRVGLRGLAVSVAVFLAVSLACATGTLQPHDPSWVAARLRQHPANPVAVIGAYEGEFGYMARLTKPVDEITVDQAAGWRTAHPDGIVIEIARRMPLGGPYVEAHPYRGGTLAIWIPGMTALAASQSISSTCRVLAAAPLCFHNPA